MKNKIEGRDRSLGRSRNNSNNAINENSNQRKKSNFENFVVPNYIIENGLRKVEPYDWNFETFAKGRWLKKKVIDIYTDEFQAGSFAYYDAAINAGKILVNGDKISSGQLITNGDLLTHIVHRHEPPVSALPNIKVVYCSKNLLVVDKPPGLPVHPTGRYNQNTLTKVLEIEGFDSKSVISNYKNYFKYDEESGNGNSLIGNLEEHDLDSKSWKYSCVNRLDRLTSGVVLLARTKEIANIMMEDMMNRNITKAYVARVKGEFPIEEVVCAEPILTISHKMSVNMVSPKGKPCLTKFKRMSYNGLTSVVLCEPKTGRTHQIRVHLQYLGFPIANDPIYCCSEVFGEEGGAKSEIQQDAILKKYKAAAFPLDKDDFHTINESKGGKDFVFDNESMNNDSLYSIESLVCQECKYPKEDPLPEQLMIYLHAFKYEKSGSWFFETELPVWAEDDYTGDRILKERFWNYGGKWDGNIKCRILE
ncbi:RNA pseudouridylate synthase domain containing protein 2 [Lobulomyces angularis]|nr:RNA pseudouridylate synthase domain containing protein 2 [Lobulomyces angularis]